MAGLGSSKRMPVSKAQQSSDGQIGAGAPVQTLPSLELSLVQGLRSSGDLSHLPYIDHSPGCHGEPTQQSWFPRDGEDVRPLERIPHDADRDVTAALAQPCAPVHQPREAEQTGVVNKARKPRRGRRIKSPVNHTEQNDREIQRLDSHLRSLVLFHFGNSEALQVFALKRILEYLQQHPPIHICRVERKNGDPRGMILLVICLLCPSGPEAPSPFKEPNALPKFAHHFRIVHCGIKNPFACVVPPCDKSFSLRHDMARHVKAAHPECDDIPDPVVASNTAGPSGTRRPFNGSSPVLTRHNTSSLPASISDPNRRVRLYPSQPTAPLNQDWDTMCHVMQPDPFRIQSASGGVPTTTQSGGAVAGPSNSHCAGYMMSANPPSVGHPSSNRSTMPFHAAHREPYGGPSHIAAPDANVSADYLRSHVQMMQPLSPFFLGGNPSSVPSGTHSQIQSRQPDPSTVVAQVALPMTSNYHTNATAENQFVQPRQNRMPSSSVQGPRQLTPARATARAVAQQRYESNGTSMSTRHAQAMRHEVDYMAIESDRLAYFLSQPKSMQPGSQYYTPSTAFQTRHAVSVQRPQPQQPLQNRADTTLGHQHTPYSPWELPQTSLNMGSWAFTGPSLDPRYPGTSHRSQTNRTRTRPPHQSGDNVSPDRKTLKGEVERKLPLWLGLIELMVGVPEAFLSAILVFLGPPRDRKGCNSIF